MSAPRVFFYVQHLLGIGHLARASRIAAALADDGFDVTVVTGGLPVPGFPGEGVRSVELPAVLAASAGFKGLADRDGKETDKAFLENRRDLLLRAFEEARPDVVIIEAFPFGRRQMRFELLPLLGAIEAADPRPKLLTSVRDILQQQKKPGRDEETVALLKAHFDGVLVHGDPTFVRLEETFPPTAEIADRISYTGLVAAPPPPPAAEKFDIVVSAGGGAVGRELISASLDAARLMPGSLNWCLVSGPNLPEGDFSALEADAPANVRLVRFRKDFPSLLGAAELSISQAGYNTVCDLMRAGCRSLLVPFTTGGETEQAVRASRLERLGLATALPESGLTSVMLADAAQASLAHPKPRIQGLDLDGARKTAELIRGMLRQ
ncbi:glycosyltransferase [Rhizobium sp. BK251]|uniref:glycosyltransferase family protein n=1 Tax=Rhizobium sp. BK251 TaxID=2512125 RepID=UPI001043C277|nr:glycosyltransferase [Rhizobium sp. BK251]TCL68348.1 putative glycosyltransferase [Rhizobium sp. BK251]